MSCSSKLIKSQEEAVGTSDLKPEVVIAQSFPDFTTSNTSISDNIFPESFVYKFREIATRRLVLLECLDGKIPLGDMGASDNSSSFHYSSTCLSPVVGTPYSPCNFQAEIWLLAELSKHSKCAHWSGGHK